MDSSRTVKHLDCTIFEWNGRPQAKQHGPPLDPTEVFCVASLDRTELTRTQTVCDVRPYWNDTCRVQVLEDFSLLSFDICEKVKNKVSLIGKVLIPQTKLLELGEADQWYPVQFFSYDEEVTGLLSMFIHLEPHGGDHRLHVDLVGGCKFLPGQMYVTCLVETGTHHSQLHRSPTSEKTGDPVWGHSFHFNLSTIASVENEELAWKAEPSLLRLTVWTITDAADAFMGEVYIPIAATHLAKKEEPEWYALAPRVRSKAYSKSEPNLGALRLKLDYIEDHVLPRMQYHPLEEMLLSSIENDSSVGSSPLGMLNHVNCDKGSVARCLYYFYKDHGKEVAALSALAEEETSRTLDSATLFRANTIATKGIDCLMRDRGAEYLLQTMLPVLDEILQSNPSCEIDPTRVDDVADLKDHLATLKYHVNRILIAIVSSTDLCPKSMRAVFARIAHAAKEKFPDKANVAHTAVSGFLFLRFFAPAIMNPKSFDLTHAHPSSSLHRTFTLISKVVQTMGNLAAEKKSKEAFMFPVNIEIVQKNRAQVVKFLELVAAPAPPAGSQRRMKQSERNVRVNITIKEGYLIKRALGRAKGIMNINRKNFKKRYFVLASNGLTYHKDKDEVALHIIHKEDICAVERVDDNAFDMPHMFQVVQQSASLYLVAESETDRRAWIAAIRSICEEETQRETYHSGAFAHDSWSCCENTVEFPTTEPYGCRRCVSQSTVFVPVTGSTQDVELNLERLHQYFQAGLQVLQQDSDCTEERSSSIQKIQEVCETISRNHKQNRPKLARKGTRHRPHSSFRDPRLSKTIIPKQEIKE